MNARAVGIIGLSATALIVASTAMGVRVNLTDSSPIGLWVEHRIDRSSLRRGQFVLICPPEKPVVQLMIDGGYLSPGNCPKTQVAPLGKRIRALPGDTVRIETGLPLKVNGFPIPNTIAKETLPTWPDGEYIVQPGDVWILSSYSEKSFDSRYFGPVPISNVRGEATPLLVNGNVEEM